MFKEKDIERFWSRVDATGDCWIWLRGKSKSGYGSFAFDGHDGYAHRFSWMLHKGTKIPHKMFVCHKCDAPACVNPSHLFLGTCRENIDDMIKKDRSGRKLHTADAAAIKALVKTKRMHNGDIAKIFGVSRELVGQIANGKWWTHA